MPFTKEVKLCVIIIVVAISATVVYLALSVYSVVVAVAVIAIVIAKNSVNVSAIVMMTMQETMKKAAAIANVVAVAAVAEYFKNIF